MGRFDTLGKLVSAHRAWGPTPHGGWVSGGRQWGVAGLPTWWVALPGQWVTLHCQCATILMMSDHILTAWHCNRVTFMLILQMWHIYYNFRQSHRACNSQYGDHERQSLCQLKASTPNVWDEYLDRVKTSYDWTMQMSPWRAWNMTLLDPYWKVCACLRPPVAEVIKPRLWMRNYRLQVKWK